jgi:2-polyprenyl-6-methoxyphenol hydroxylase-like FAD-dependent oxidoreductase
MNPDMLAAPVGIVGGGPVGMTLALLLDRLGVASVIFNTEVTTRWHPKGSTESARTMEIFRLLGLADPIRALGLPADHPTDVAYFTRFNGFELARLRMPSRADVTAQRQRAAKTDQTPEPIHRANQMHVDRLLLEHLRTRPRITLRFGWQANKLEQDEKGVTLVAIDAQGQREAWRLHYLAGCDGGRSFVRRALGIGFRGEGSLEERYFGGRMFSTYIRSPALAGLLRPRRAWQYWAVNPDARSTVISVDGGAEFLFRTKAAAPNQPAEDTDIRAALDAGAGTSIPADIVAHEPWTAGAALVAERFQDRRVVLAGDAVHLFTPTGGFGMNTGLEDACNLAWKLAACVQGWGGPRLLETCEIERLPVALRNTAAARQLSININDVHAPKEIEADTREGAVARAAAAEQLATFDEQFRSIGVQLGARYDESPVVVPDGTSPPDDFAVYRPSSLPGGRAPHAWLDEKHGAGGSLYDRLGLGFTLLRLGARAPEGDAFAAAARSRGIPLTRLDIADLDIRDLYGCDLVLIRPDQHVAWRGNAEPTDAAAVMARLTGA